MKDAPDSLVVDVPHVKHEQAPAKVVEKAALEQPTIKPDVVKKRSVAVLLGRITPEHRKIASIIEDDFPGDVEIYQMNEPAQSAEDAIAAIQNSSHLSVAAIGPYAANQSLQLEGKNIAFAGVFDIKGSMLDSGLLGVSMLPNPDKLFPVWKKLNPELEKVAILTGPGFQKQIKRIEDSATRHNIKLIHREVSNDKEMLYQSEKLHSLVQGYWMLPDHRILSRRSMKGFMSSSLKKGKQVVVFNRQLLNYGGLIFIEASPEDVGKKLLEQLNNEEVKLRYSSQVNLVVNPAIAEKLGLDISHTPAEYLHGVSNSQI